jgi:hypothetical protein
MRLHARTAIAATLLLLVACSPTGTEEAGPPALEGPDEVVGTWKGFQLVCTIPLTLRTGHPIVITGGSLRAVFPAEGDPKASVERDFTPEEVELLWGPAPQGNGTSSVEINPLVQYEDYEATISFGYMSERDEGSLEHVARCRSNAAPHA